MLPVETEAVSSSDLQSLRTHFAPGRERLLLDRFFEISPNLLALVSARQGTWFRVNSAFSSILGWQEHDLLGNSFFDIVHPRDLARAKAAEAKLLHGHPLINFQHRVLRKDGGHRWIAWDTAVFKEEGLIFCIGRDVTRSRRAVKRLRLAKERMQRVNAELEQFACTAGHDLQEPLRTLSMYSNLLMRGYWGELPEGMTDFLVTISAASERMQALVRNLLEYARVSAAQHPPTVFLQTVCLESVFKDVLLSLESAVRECSATITHDSLPDVQGDAIQLSQVLLNLLSNSIRYRCKEGPLWVHVGVDRQCAQWRFHVTDNGRGFEPEQAEHIFVPFKRLHSHDDISGTGLGLSICRRILERHAGRIWAEGRPAQGATFWFTLPA